METSLQSGPAFHEDFTSIGASFLSRLFSIQSFFVLPLWKLFNYHWLVGKNLDRQPASIRPGLHLAYTLTGVKLNNNRTQYSIGQQFFGSVTKALSRNYIKRKVFRLCLFFEMLRFIRFFTRTLSKMNKTLFFLFNTFRHRNMHKNTLFLVKYCKYRTTQRNAEGFVPRPSPYPFIENCWLCRWCLVLV